MKLIKTFVINGIIVTITSLILRCIGLFFNSYISQKIGAEAVGLYGLVMSIYGLAITIALSGINLATTKIVSEEIAIGNTSSIARIVRKCLIFSVLFSCIAIFILITFAPIICKTWLHNKVSTLPFYIISVSLPFISMSSCLTGYFSAVRNTLKPASDQIFEQLLKVLLISMFLNYFMPCGLEYICISLILGNIISEIISFIYIFTLYKLDEKRFANLRKSQNYFEKRILEITIPVGLTSFFRSGLSTIKQILIPIGFEKNGNTCEQALANYGLISGMAMPLILFPNTIVLAFSNLLIPEFSEFNVRSEYSRIQRITKKILKYTLVFSIIISIIIFIFATQFSQLLYKSTHAIVYIKLLAPLIPIMYIDNVIDAILKGLDKQITVLKINILDLITSILLIFIIIPKFGIIGYIFTIYFSEILNFSLSFSSLHKTYNNFSL